MPAYSPQECDLKLLDAVHAGDVEAAVALYEANASLVLGPDNIVMGQDGIRAVLWDWLLVPPSGVSSLQVSNP